MSLRTDPRQLLPLLLILHLLLNFMDTLQGFKALIQQEGCVINQHVDIAHKLLAGAERETGRGEDRRTGRIKLINVRTTTYSIPNCVI